jgi:hypothetical protein
LANDLGPPPEEKASQNRMSPLGIPMFYAASNAETAKLEINELSGTIAKFEQLTDMKIIDFCSVPIIPSIFDRENRSHIMEIKFIIDFIADITKPVKKIKDKTIHLEYIPTQVLTEYFRFLYEDKIDGIKYPSSYDQGENIVLFLNQSHVCDFNEKVTKGKFIMLLASEFF